MVIEVVYLSTLEFISDINSVKILFTFIFTIKTVKNSCKMDQVLHRKPGAKDLFTSPQSCN